MFRPAKIVVLPVFVLSFASTLYAASQRQPRIHQIDSATIANKSELRIENDVTTTTTHHINPLKNAVWRVDGWVTGSELYKAYLDPSESCQDPYPFSVTEINMPMYFTGPTVIYVSVDVEDAFYSAPYCPWPDSVLAISSDYAIPIAKAGLYDIWVPLDQAVVVNGPFFAGFFIGNAVDSSTGVGVLAGNDPSALCRSYNIWDEQIGFIDLLNNPLWSFPGELVIRAGGYPGGGDRPTPPEPKVTILSPCDGQQVLREANIWAHESSGTDIIEYVSFEYGVSGEFIELGRDYNNVRPLPGSAENSDFSGGYNFQWNFSHLEEGTITLRVTACDTLGRCASDEISVYVEPTPPTPRIIAPANTGDFCSEVDILISCADEDLRGISLYHKKAVGDFSAGIQPLDQAHYGDVNGNPHDGNSVERGEFGNCYSGPVAVAMALGLWYNRGYISLIDTESKTATFDILVEELATRFLTRQKSGTSHEYLYRGLLDYGAGHDEPLTLERCCRPDYATLRIKLEEEQKAVLLATGETGADWLAVDGFSGWKQDDGSYLVSIANPATGKIEWCAVRDYGAGSQLKLAGVWHPVEALVSIGATDWHVNRQLIGTDTDQSDGWSFYWTPDDLETSTRHFIRAESIDNTGIKHHNTVVLNYDCSTFFIPGDYNGDGAASIIDLLYLSEFIMNDGPQPVGGALRADANGDSRSNITDLVFYINYLYGDAGSPAH
ncbi:MAG: hypothetical protein JSU74_05650 [Candidatus Zixiibacteriota bacterium]|nr:MAG: hypothetical protein JSU74_05650 [candidate division Zixibacteria bacterium]